MKKPTIGLLNKKRGNYALQEKYSGPGCVHDETEAEVEHHAEALQEAGFQVARINWGADFIRDLETAQVELVFNVSSLVEAAILEELEIPFVGSGTTAITNAMEKSFAKRLWRHHGLPTSGFLVARTPQDLDRFKEDPPLPFPLFVKPVAGRGSAGIDESSIASSYDELLSAVTARLDRIGQPVLIERYLQGREITLGVLGNTDARVLPPLEITYSEGSRTLTFEKKELDNDTFTCPASLSEEDGEKMRWLALQACSALGTRDYCRVDTIMTDKGPYLLEVNAFAGLMCTPAELPRSYIGIMARADGLDSQSLLGEIIQAACARLNISLE